MTFIGNLSIWIYIPKYIKKIPLSSLKPFSNFKDIFSLFIPAIAIQVYTMLDKTMIGAFAVGNAENGYYEQAEKIVRIGLAIVTSLGTVMIPRIAKVFAEKNDRLVKEYLQKSYQFVWLLGIPLMFGIIGVSNVFVPVFFGDGYEKVKILLPIYSCIIIPVALSNVTGCQFLIPTKRQNIYTIAVTVSALFNFVLNAVLIPKYLSTGAAIATVFAELAGSTIMLVYVNYKKQIEVKKVFKLSIKNVVSGLLMLVLLLLLSNILPVNVITLGVLIVIGGSTYFISLFILKDIFFINNILSIFNKIIRK